MPTKAQKKQAAALSEAFHRRYARQYGEERWTQSLLPALLRPTRYALMVNRYAVERLEVLVDRWAATDPPASGQSAGRLRQGPPGEGQISEGQPSEGQPGAGQTKEAQGDQSVETTTTESASPKFLPLPFLSGESLLAYVGSTDKYPPPSAADNGLQTHWNLDAASLLAVHALCVRPGDSVLDLCAAPGGKSMAIAQYLAVVGGDAEATATVEKSKTPAAAMAGSLHSNEDDAGRHRRLANNLDQYLGPSTRAQRQCLRLDGSQAHAWTQLPAWTQSQGGGVGRSGYRRVLVDAPCSSERHILHAQARAERGGGGGGAGVLCDELASWRSTHSRNLAKVQAALLRTALNAVCVAAEGGRVVYATCSLSDEENDGVVARVCEQVAKDRKRGVIDWDVRVISHITHEKREAEAGTGETEMRLDEWAERTQYGWIVLPDHPSGGQWGPLFFAMLEKTTKKTKTTKPKKSKEEPRPDAESKIESSS